jgi:nucleotide-binding universal stress UspA family protein
MMKHAVERRRSRKPFTVLVANDGSPQARAALHAAVHFPWPADAGGSGLVAWGGERWAARTFSQDVAARLTAGARRVARETEQTLRRRWPKAHIDLVEEPMPAEAILRRIPRNGTIVVGAHGYTPLKRWMLGSVSRAVVRRAASSVLVVKGRRPAPRHFSIGYDGSSNARRAVAFVGKLNVPRNGRVTLLGFFDPIYPPTNVLMPSRLRAELASQVRAVTAQRLDKMQRQLDRAAKTLEAEGWKVRTTARPGVAVRDLVRAAVTLRSDVIVVGARGASRLRRVLLGSVAESVLDQSPMPVLVVR